MKFKITSIQQKITVYFLSIIFTLTCVSIVFGAFHLKTINRYQEIENSIYSQYSLINLTQGLIGKYNDYRNGPTPDNLNKYLAIRKNIKDTIFVLKQEIVDNDSKQLLSIVDNTISNILSETDKGVKSISENDITNTSLYYYSANKKFDFVKENTGDLILSQINYSRTLEVDMQKTQKVIIIFGSILLLFVTLLSIILSIFWVKTLVSPLLEIILIAKEISNGNFKKDISEKLLNREDEIGDLIKSFKEMTLKLKESRVKLELQVKETNEKSVELEEQVKKTENSKIAILNLLEDIEIEKKKVEGLVVERTKELSLEKARLLASINSLSFGFIIADMNHHVLLKNNAITKLFGIKDTDEASISHISEILGNRLDIKKQVELCFKDQKMCEIKEIVFDSKFFRAIIAPILTPENNQDIGYVFLLEDITESRAIDKAKTEFVSLASHQLRTPLSAINWYTEMLLSGDAGKLNAEQLEFLEDIITSSKRMSSLVGTLLNVSRIELGTFAIDPENKDLCEIIEEEVEDLRVQFDDKKIKLELLFNLKPAFVFVDPKLMSIVIQNFLTNAIKYNSLDGKVSISVDKKEETGEVVFSIMDTGYGIPIENQGKIFTKMYRADNALALDAEGSGLGLYMVKSILEKSGCKISFESPPNGKEKGTVFYVSIPKEGMKQIKANKRLGNRMS